MKQLLHCLVGIGIPTVTRSRNSVSTVTSVKKLMVRNGVSRSLYGLDENSSQARRGVVDVVPIFCLLLFFNIQVSHAQSFYLGADLSYVNEMEDCGVTYYEAGEAKDPYAIFGENACNLVRLRLWHTPTWYDDLNEGKRYSDLADVKRAIARAKAQEMEVLLDFHLSDNWADPDKQVVPAAWLSVVDDTEVLADSLYNYIFQTLEDLQGEDLLPEMIQIGNETNKGILLSPEDNVTWTLDWLRNATLFNKAIRAVRDFETQNNASVKILLHLADPDKAERLVGDFYRYGVRDFDAIGMSYYWAWHQPTSIAETGEVVARLRENYPEKEVFVVETGYIWTTDYNDAANNIISETHPDYSPASPENQRDWMIDMTQTVYDAGASGVIYWEPAWVSSDCYTQWGRGSHQEHATFFDFDNHLITNGGIAWMSHQYEMTSSATPVQEIPKIKIFQASNPTEIVIKQPYPNAKIHYRITDISGRLLVEGKASGQALRLPLGTFDFGLYLLTVEVGNLKKTRLLLL